MRAIFMIIFAFMLFSCLDTLAKFAGQSVPALEAAWARFVGHAILAILVFQPWRNRSIMKTNQPFNQALRGLFLMGSTIFNFLALRHLQLAETMSIMFAGPFVVTALAGPVLGEWAGRRRWGAIIVGFLGVLIVTRPGIAVIDPAVLYSIAAMLCYAGYALMTRKMSPAETARSLIFYSALLPAIIMTPIAVSVWVAPPNWMVYAELAGMGVFGFVGHWFLIKANQLADVPTLAPFLYTQIVWMVGLGYVAFNEIPGIWTMLGSAVIVSSGLYLLYRERVVNKHAE
ncbi:MAG: DMT family transporter [Rhizobiales bacterium]|nr:DMT family transporter [Hyphomicrobiales bacterium]